MPELPEIETICQGLQKLIDTKIIDIYRSNKKLRIESSLDLQGLKGEIVKNVIRKARYLIVNFYDNHSLIIHLGMSGSVVLQESLGYTIKKHDHFVCHLNNHKTLVFNDPRRFGFVDLAYTKNLPKHKMLANLGCEPLCDDFNVKYLVQKLKNKKMNIKTTMMDNKIAVGVGNIYISESLFVAKISPLRLANTLTLGEIKKLIIAIKNTLKSAIKLGGSSINDYVNSSGKKGDFQKTFKVYGNNHKKCCICDGLVKKIVQNGRSSFYCEFCQK